LTLKQKYDLVQEAEKKAKPTQKELGIKFGIGKTTVSDILKRKSEYTQLFEENTTSQRKQHNSGSKYGEPCATACKHYRDTFLRELPSFTCFTFRCKCGSNKLELTIFL
jgi:hypothetical protein